MNAPALKEFRLVWDIRAGGTRFQSRVVLTKKENLRQSFIGTVLHRDRIILEWIKRVCCFLDMRLCCVTSGLFTTYSLGAKFSVTNCVRLTPTRQLEPANVIPYCYESYMKYLYYLLITISSYTWLVWPMDVLAVLITTAGICLAGLCAPDGLDVILW